MTVDYIDLEADLSAMVFKTTIGTPTISSDGQDISIPYVGTANPARTDVEISSYKYSIDNGVTWVDMTTESTLTSLTFSTSGTSLTLVWKARNDISGSVYNTQLKVALIGVSGVYTTIETVKTFINERTVTTSTTAENPLFPATYKGVPGYTLMSNAPRTNIR